MGGEKRYCGCLEMTTEEMDGKVTGETGKMSDEGRKEDRFVLGKHQKDESFVKGRGISCIPRKGANKDIILYLSC